MENFTRLPWSRCRIFHRRRESSSAYAGEEICWCWEIGWLNDLVASSYALLPFPILMCCAVNSLFLSVTAARKSARKTNARSPTQPCERHHPASSVRSTRIFISNHVHRTLTHAGVSSGAIKLNCAIQHGAAAVH